MAARPQIKAVLLPRHRARAGTGSTQNGTLRFSRMLDLGTLAPSFALPDSQGKVKTLDEIADGKPVLVAFICNHSPVVQHIIGSFAHFARQYQARGLAVVAISANDVTSHPEDAPEKMAAFAREHRFTFPYLYDESQRTALAYQAICTPDFFLFYKNRRLAYRGQFDSSRPPPPRSSVRGRPPRGTDLPITGSRLRAAADAVLADRPATGEQIPSAGCSIKWKPENQPTWA